MDLVWEVPIDTALFGSILGRVGPKGVQKVRALWNWERALGWGPRGTHTLAVEHLYPGYWVLLPQLRAGAAVTAEVLHSLEVLASYLLRVSNLSFLAFEVCEYPARGT